MFLTALYPILQNFSSCIKLFLKEAFFEQILLTYKISFRSPTKCLGHNLTRDASSVSPSKLINDVPSGFWNFKLDLLKRNWILASLKSWAGQIRIVLILARSLDSLCRASKLKGRPFEFSKYQLERSKHVKCIFNCGMIILERNLTSDAAFSPTVQIFSRQCKLFAGILATHAASVVTQPSHIIQKCVWILILTLAGKVTN